MSKHTPGPWVVGTPGPNGCYTVGTAQGLMTAVIAESLHDNPEVASADASLVSAAPELLEALMLAVEDEPNACFADTARAAIAKAKGETK